MNDLLIQVLDKVEQGSGDEFTYFIGVLEAEEIAQNSEVARLSESSEGVQRFLNKKRVEDIAKYCETENAIFPTPIILSLNSDFTDDQPQPGKPLTIKIQENSSELGKPFSIIDGQHRIAGISAYRRGGGEKKFSIPIFFYEDADQFTSAMIFVTINSNQKPVDPSTIYQLFGIIYDSDKAKKEGLYTVQSFSSRATSILNETSGSPFYHAIKMLGRKSDRLQFLSQGTVAKKITDRISSKPVEDNLKIEQHEGLDEDSTKPFRQYFSNNQPEQVALNIIIFFKLFETVFKPLWNDPSSLVKKAVGFSALMHVYDWFEKRGINPEIIKETFLRLPYEKVAETFSGDQGSSESIALNISRKLISLINE